MELYEAMKVSYTRRHFFAPQSQILCYSIICDSETEVTPAILVFKIHLRTTSKEIGVSCTMASWAAEFRTRALRVCSSNPLFFYVIIPPFDSVHQHKSKVEHVESRVQIQNALIDCTLPASNISNCRSSFLRETWNFCRGITNHHYDRSLSKQQSFEVR